MRIAKLDSDWKSTENFSIASCDAGNPLEPQPPSARTQPPHRASFKGILMSSHTSSLDSTSEPRPSTQTIRHSLYETWKELGGVQERIRFITKEIEEASASLRRLREIETRLLGVAAVKAPLLSPFQHLPRDVLSEIASIVLFMDNSIVRENRGILPLTRVCKAWRCSILSLPHLWSSFSIGSWIVPFGPYDKFPPLHVVSTFLERSKNHPLSFSIDGSRDEIESTSRIMFLLAKHSARWKSIKLKSTIPPTPLLDIYENLPLLERLILNIHNSKIATLERWLPIPSHRRIFAVAPRLRSVQLFDTLKFLEFPLHQLYNVECNVTLDDSPAARGNWKPVHFPECNNLRSLRIICHKERWEGWHEVFLPALRDLLVEDCTSVLRMFRSPSLRSLELSWVQVNAASFDDVRIFLNSISDGELTSFNISVIDDDTGCHMEKLFSLSGFSSLRNLSITQLYPHDLDPIEYRSQCMPWIKPLLSRSIYKHPGTDGEDSPLLLPHLRNFALEFEREVEEDGVLEVLREFILSRTMVIGESNGDIDPRRNTSNHDNSGGYPSIPSQLEAVNVKCSEYAQPLTLYGFNLVEAKIRILMEDIFDGRYAPGPLFSSLVTNSTSYIQDVYG